MKVLVVGSGGTVERLEQEGGKTVIGCTSCDMRIQIEN